jgi:PAS domain S-box-containing protein
MSAGQDPNGGDVEASDARQRGFLEAALDCVIMIDATGQVVEFNPAAERTFGYRRADVIGRTLADLIVPPSLRDRHRDALRTFVDTRRPTLFGQRVEVTGMRADGSEFPVELALSEVEADPLLIFGALRDLTAAKKAEADLRRLAEEQAALRRVAILVARDHDSAEVFDAVCAESARLVDAAQVTLVQFGSPSGGRAMAAWRSDEVAVDLEQMSPLDEHPIAALVRDTGAPQRVDTPLHAMDGIDGPPYRAEVGAPITLDGRLWGALVADSEAPEGFPVETEARVAMFADVVAISIGNAVTKDELLTSRRRLVHAADDARRKLGRDLHDGAQQRLVVSLMNLQLADERFDTDRESVREGLREALDGLRQGLGELRDLAAGLHPTILTNHGLGPAIEALADRSPIPVRLEVPAERYPIHLESDVYFLVAEGLTNIAKHANASYAAVSIDEQAGRLLVELRDDGRGGVNWEGGTGLRGLRDRIDAVGGEFTVESTPGAGTRLSAALPIPAESPGR